MEIIYHMLQTHTKKVKSSIFDGLIQEKTRYTESEVVHERIFKYGVFEKKDEYWIPGQKIDVLKDNCGKFVRLLQCKDSKIPVPILHSCNNRNCPRCYGAWALRQGKRSHQRFRVYNEKTKSGKLYHWSASVEVEKKFDYKKIKKKISNFFNGGSIVYHHYRHKKFCKECGKEALKKDQNICECGNDSFVSKWLVGPHFHVISDTKYLDTKKISEKEKIIMHRIRELEDIDIEKVVSYEVSHASYKQDEHIISYFGRMAYNKLKVIKIKPKIPVMCNCKKCKELEYRYRSIMDELDTELIHHNKGLDKYGQYNEEYNIKIIGHLGTRYDKVEILLPNWKNKIKLKKYVEKYYPGICLPKIKEKIDEYFLK